MRVKVNGWSGPRRALVAGLAMSALVALVTGHALGAPLATPTISTQGVVIFGQLDTTSNRGTYRMNPDGTGIVRVTTQVTATDVSRGPAVMTLLIASGSDGDIYAQRADGVGAPIPLVAGPANDVQARFNADGTRILWVSVIPTPYTWSIHTAAVERNGAGEVSGISGAVVVWSGPNQIRGIDFSRDGTKIVCALNTGPGFDLFVLHLGDGILEQLTSTSELEAWPRWSPVDDRIAYLRRTDASSNICSLLTIDYATRATKTILAGGSRQYATDISAGVCWSPGGTHLLTVVGGSKKPIDLYQFPSAGGSGVNVTPTYATPPGAPCWGW